MSIFRGLGDLMLDEFPSKFVGQEDEYLWNEEIELYGPESPRRRSRTFSSPEEEDSEPETAAEEEAEELSCSVPPVSAMKSSRETEGKLTATSALDRVYDPVQDSVSHAVEDEEKEGNDYYNKKHPSIGHQLLSLLCFGLR